MVQYQRDGNFELKNEVDIRLQEIGTLIKTEGDNIFPRNTYDVNEQEVILEYSPSQQKIYLIAEKVSTLESIVVELGWRLPRKETMRIRKKSK